MAFFDKLKDMNEMRKQAKEIQGALAQEQVMGTSHDGAFKITMDGNQNLLNVEIGESIVGDKQTLEKGCREAFTHATDQLKKILATRFSSMLK
ncbi:MAG: YbaB/EbfC family nucleoid-associated protein [bacterium]|nr:YbaB/EbfC family nucleoid-associated protein [bacterium]